MRLTHSNPTIVHVSADKVYRSAVAGLCPVGSQVRCGKVHTFQSLSANAATSCSPTRSVNLALASVAFRRPPVSADSSSTPAPAPAAPALLLLAVAEEAAAADLVRTPVAVPGLLAELLLRTGAERPAVRLPVVLVLGLPVGESGRCTATKRRSRALGIKAMPASDRGRCKYGSGVV